MAAASWIIRFKTALECFFKWSLVLNPQSQHALLNFALVMQGVVGDHDKAEAYYRCHNTHATPLPATAQRIPYHTVSPWC